MLNFLHSWAEAQLWAIVKDFPKVTEDPHRFSEEFKTDIQPDQPGFSDSYQLVLMLIGEGQAQHCIKLLIGKVLKGL